MGIGDWRLPFDFNHIHLIKKSKIYYLGNCIYFIIIKYILYR
jgi:hypothetical protein